MACLPEKQLQQMYMQITAINGFLESGQPPPPPQQQQQQQQQQKAETRALLMDGTSARVNLQCTGELLELQCTGEPDDMQTADFTADLTRNFEGKRKGSAVDVKLIFTDRSVRLRAADPDEGWIRDLPLALCVADMD
ncbi:hypothetical protein OEZ85_003578 [Tetradesmus obliquus]|uniref:Uncharacterized protein n=1 Tax=Tetradesmus obliquus TaxID=3088 RepID=A0ABY8UEN8_TETOB|nr:hypothetical protein OEZ85_003578 [Tetradesmus obliquus]